MSTSTTTIRIDRESHEKLRELADEAGTTLQDELSEAIEAHYRRRFLEAVNAAYERLRADPVAWQEELDERALWDTTLMDGLRDDEWTDE